MKLFNRFKRLCDLEQKYKELFRRVEILENNYRHMLVDVKRLEEENIDTTNELYRLENSLESKIDILASEFLNDKER